MAFKHYGGSTPAGPAEWICPSCQHVNTVPLKAGCQACRAGADARKVEEIPLVPPRTAGASDEDHAFYTWVLNARPQWHPSASETDKLKEAFMAGVAWAQAQPTLGGTVHSYNATATTPVRVEDGVARIVIEGFSTEAEQVTRATVLAALAFYRDNVLGYGSMPGQLDAAGVDALIARLTPKPEEEQ